MQGPFMSLAPNLSPCFLICKVGIIVPGSLKSQRCGGTLWVSVSPLGTPGIMKGPAAACGGIPLSPFCWRCQRSSEALPGP